MTGEPAVISLADLREALRRLLDAAEEQFGAVIDLGADHHWAIDSRGAFDLSTDPEVEVGQLSDDTATVRDLLAREDGEIFLWHDLDHVIAILQRVAGLARP